METNEERLELLCEGLMRRIILMHLEQCLLKNEIREIKQTLEEKGKEVEDER